MSHFTTIKTRLTSKGCILKGLDDAGLRYEVGELQVEGFGGKLTPVDIKELKRGANWEFGFRQAGDSYELIGDWWGIHDLDRQEFLQRLNQRYAYHAVKEQLMEQQESGKEFTLVEEETQNNTIHLVLRRMV